LQASPEPRGQEHRLHGPLGVVPAAPTSKSIAFVARG
jgi:hypothetical protein